MSKLEGKADTNFDAKTTTLAARHFSSPGYPFIQIFPILLSIIMLMALGTQSLMLGAATLLTGLVFHSLYIHVRQKGPKTPLG